ncbi:MAG: hypothetical protein KJ025_19245 [Burkholderiales bacterium]|nr:hypothetical protein [Burkholderiales bacterium]
MTQTLSLGWTQAEARSRRSSYRRLLAVNLVLTALVALLAIVSPATLAHLLGLPAATPSAWPRAWGGMVLLAVLLYLPGWFEPVRARWANVVGIAGRGGMALLYLLVALCGDVRGFLWLALYDGGFAAALAVGYFRLFRAELMSRP